jgi:MFS superfamily sulfate permease-like transporter
MCVSGVTQIAALWLRELTGTALIDGLWGTVYLAIGIGLFGHSRFSLVLGVVIPCAAIAALFYTVAQPAQIYALRIAIDVVVVLLCATVVWETRDHPGM